MDLMGILRLFDLLDLGWILLSEFLYSYIVCALCLVFRHVYMIVCSLHMDLMGPAQMPNFLTLCLFVSMLCACIQIFMSMYLFNVYYTCMHLLCSLQMGLMGPARLPDLLINTSHPPYSAPPTFSLSLPHRHKQKQNHNHPNITPNAYKIQSQPKSHLNHRLPHIFKI